jgi:hypothetical protein
MSDEYQVMSDARHVKNIWYPVSGVSHPAFLLALFLSAALHAGETSPPRALDYPKDLRAFRAKALDADGRFAPDIAFALRTCPKCNKPYVFGTFPRLKRQPFDNLAAVHQIVETVCLKKAPSSTMYSAREKQMVARACPACNEPEGAGRPDKVLFCHLIPETGADMQIEYDVRDGKLLSRTYWLVPKEDGARKVELPDETEDSIKKAFGCHFSLRAVWNELFAQASREGIFSLDGARIAYRQVAPGMWFIVRPPGVSADEFKAFAEGRLKADRDKGLFTHFDTPLKLDAPLSSREGAYKDWAATYEAQLSTGRMECFVAFSLPELQRAAREVLESRRLSLEIPDVAKPSDPAIGTISKGGFKTEIQFDALGSQAIYSGLSLHHACAYYLTIPAFTVENAGRLNRAIRARFRDCAFKIEDSRKLIVRDPLGEERQLDLVKLAENLDPDDAALFDLFCSTMLAWDQQKGGFAPKRLDRDVSPTGLPAFIERRIRPAGHLRGRDLIEALYEPREDKNGRLFELCYTSECTTGVVYVDAAKDRFKGMTLDEARQLYESAAGTLPMYVDAQTWLSFPGNEHIYVEKVRRLREDGKRPRPEDLAGWLRSCKAALLGGLDLASLAADSARAVALAQVAGMPVAAGERLHFYAFTANAVALAPRKLTADEQQLAHSRIKALLADSGLEPGLELGLYFDLPHAEPRGRVVRRSK